MAHLPSRRRRMVAFLFLSAAAFAAASGQTAHPGALPDAPSASTGAQQDTPPVSLSAQPDLSGKQTRRILGIIPNFRSVSVDQKLPPQSAKDKFKATSQDAFDYSDVVYSALLAGVAQAEDSYPEFHQGAAGYGRYFWHTFADEVDEDYQVEFVFPVVFHQDSRFYTLGHGSPLKRTAYSFSRILITRTDSGARTFNASEIIGAGAASGISNLYYPGVERTWTKTGQRWLVNVGLDGATFVFQEFWPDLNSRFFHQKD